MQSAAFCAEHQTLRVWQTCQGPGCAHTSCSGALHSHGQTSGKRAGFQKALPWKTSQKFQNLLQEQRLLWAARLRSLSRGSTLLKMLLSRASQPQSLPKMCFCTPPLIQWWIFLAWPWTLLITVDFSGDVVCWFSPGCSHPSLASEATASAPAPPWQDVHREY